MSTSSHDEPKLSTLPLHRLHALVEPIAAPRSSYRGTFVNWGRGYTCTPLTVFEPESEYHCQVILELAKREGKSVRAVGVGHSPSDLPCTTEYMIRMTKFNQILEMDETKQHVVVQAGATLFDLHSALKQRNLAMSIIGAISDVTIAGCISTATHGSGLKFPCIAAYVLSLVLLDSSGSRVLCSPTDHSDLFHATLSGLGSTGIILEVKIQLEKSFRLQEKQRSWPFAAAIHQLESFAESTEHARLWYFPHTDQMRLSTSDRTTNPVNYMGSWLWDTLFSHHIVQLLLFLSSVPGLSFLLAVTGRLASWLLNAPTEGVDDSIKIFNTDCRYPQHITEWAIPYDSASSCIHDVRAWLRAELADPKGLRPHFPLEIRFSEADNIWLSPAYGRRTCWLSYAIYKPYAIPITSEEDHKAIFEGFARILRVHGGRPHWAKAHGLGPDELRKLYPRFDDYVRVVRSVDPDGRFGSVFAQRHFGLSSPNGMAEEAADMFRRDVQWLEGDGQWRP